jgi:hypothetical protein
MENNSKALTYADTSSSLRSILDIPGRTEVPTSVASPPCRFRHVESVWIVYRDAGPGNAILGVFSEKVMANDYLDEISVRYPNAAFLSEFPVPWTDTDGSVMVSGH